MRVLIKKLMMASFICSIGVSTVWAQSPVALEGDTRGNYGAYQELTAPSAQSPEAQPSDPDIQALEAEILNYSDIEQDAKAQAVMPASADPRPIIPIMDPQENESTYTLGKEDVIQVVVMRHPEVSGNYIINAEGKIQYEFIGDVVVEGMTKEQVKDALTQLLSTYIVSPEVTVKIVGYNSKVIYVIGEVGAPGRIYMRGDTITVREALVQAGLPLLTAANKKSKVITPSESGNAVQRDVNVDALLYEGDLRENLVMKPGDTLYIPPTFLAKTMRVINPIAQPIGTAAGTGRTVVAPF